MTHPLCDFENDLLLVLMIYARSSLSERDINLQ